MLCLYVRQKTIPKDYRIKAISYMEALGFVYTEDEYSEHELKFNNKVFLVALSLDFIGITKRNKSISIMSETDSFIYLLSTIGRFIKDFDEIMKIKLGKENDEREGIHFDGFIKTIDDAFFFEVELINYQGKFKPSFPCYYSLNHGFVTKEDQLLMSKQISTE